MSKKLLFKGGHATGMIPYEIEDFSTLYMVDARVDEKTKAYIDSVIGNSVLNLCPYRNVLVTHKYDTVEGNVVTLDDCQDDEVIQLSEIQGNTMVNCCKDGSKELTLNGDIDTSGYNNVTLTEGVDNGKVDVSLEGNTMVNVCDQEDPIAITKNYEVTTGNHVALQGEYDGKCRPNIYGNTLVNLIDFEKNATNFGGNVSYENGIITLTETVFGQTYAELTRMSIASALRWAIETLQCVYPKAKIFVASPLQTSRKEGNFSYNSNLQKRNIIEKVCQFCSVEFIDSFSRSGYSTFRANDNGDGIHPGADWKERIAQFVANEIKNKYII